MADIEAELSIRRRINQLEQDMKRANQRAADAVTELRRATILPDSPAQLDLDIIEAAVADLKAARSDYLAALRARNELREKLGVA